MKKQKPDKLLSKLLLRGGSRVRLWAALLAVSAGTLLLLLSVMAWWNFQLMLSGRFENDSLGSTFLTVSKEVEDAYMGNPAATEFTDREMEALENAPQVQDVGRLVSNRFPVYATLGGSLGFATDLFLEGVPDRFIEQKPVDWYWQYGSRHVPVILSSEFLNLYNYGFAMSRGLPQLSKNSVKALSFTLNVGEGEKQEVFTAHVVGFSDRISSVLVPESFIQFGNKVHYGDTNIAPSRLVLKVGDPSDKAFINYLEQRNYETNTEMLRWNRLRKVTDAASLGTGVLALLLLGMGSLVFILFIELTITRARNDIAILLQLGYRPNYLAKFIIKRFVPYLLLAMLLSVLLAMGAQHIISSLVQKINVNLPTMPGWPVWVALAISLFLLLAFVSRAAFAAIKKV